MKTIIKILCWPFAFVKMIIAAVCSLVKEIYNAFNRWWDSMPDLLAIGLGLALSIWIYYSIGVGAVDFYRDNYGRQSHNDYQLSENIYVHRWVNGDKLFDATTGKYTTGKIDYMTVFADDSLAIYTVKNRYGFININTGKVVVNAKQNNYTYLWHFSEGLAAAEKDGKIGFINASNEVVIPFQYSCYPEQSDIYDEFLGFQNGMSIMVGDKGSMGLINACGEWVVEPIYDSISLPTEQGWRIVELDGRAGIINESLEVVRDTVYDQITYNEADFLYTFRKDQKMWAEDRYGNIVIPFMYEYSEVLYYTEEDNTIGARGDNSRPSLYARYNIGYRFGILDLRTGLPTTPAIYDYINAISADRFEVCLPNGENFIINSKGQLVE